MKLDYNLLSKKTIPATQRRTLYYGILEGLLDHRRALTEVDSVIIDCPSELVR